jgi:hypothetical protein
MNMQSRRPGRAVIPVQPEVLVLIIVIVLVTVLVAGGIEATDVVALLGASAIFVDSVVRLIRARWRPRAIPRSPEI